ncbi:MAG: hypothetical protein L6R30_16995 [Thermoanaerobaculia bacterium]|nr:hypothetical protein [Thermoanaerobaculia bacterium]
MPGILTQHMDEFSLLRFAAGDMNDIERVHARRHLNACEDCQRALVSMERIDGILTDLGPDLLVPFEGEELPENDPFASRPTPKVRPSLAVDIQACLAATRRARETQERLYSAARESESASREAILGLDLADLADRYALCFALDGARQLMAEGIQRWLSFAACAVHVLEDPAVLGTAPPMVEQSVPLADLQARARLLHGFARLWTGDYEEGGRDFAAAYRLAAQGTAAESSFATVEMYESQRRTFLDRPREALLLAERARSTFELLGLEEEQARSQVAKGLALSALDRDDEAIVEFRATLPVFARTGLWNAHASVVSNIGASLVALGKLDEARRQYAAAMRGAAARPAIFAFLRFNLALLLLEGGKFPEAASAFEAAAALFSQQGSRPDSLSAELYQVEALARGGELARASAMLESFREKAPDGELPTEMLDALEQALVGFTRDPLRLTVLREQAETIIRTRSARLR